MPHTGTVNNSRNAVLDPMAAAMKEPSQSHQSNDFKYIGDSIVVAVRCVQPKGKQCAFEHSPICRRHIISRHIEAAATLGIVII